MEYAKCDRAVNKHSSFKVSLPGFRGAGAWPRLRGAFGGRQLLLWFLSQQVVLRAAACALPLPKSHFYPSKCQDSYRRFGTRSSPCHLQAAISPRGARQAGVQNPRANKCKTATGDWSHSPNPSSPPVFAPKSRCPPQPHVPQAPKGQHRREERRCRAPAPLKHPVLQDECNYVLIKF